MTNEVPKKARAKHKPKATLPEMPSGVKLVRTLLGHTQMIGRIAWSPEGRILASPSWDSTIRLWDTLTGECLRIFRGATSEVSCVTFDPTGQILASGSSDGNIILWDVASGKTRHLLKGHSKEVTCIAFNPTSRILATGCDADTVVRLWEADSGRLLRELQASRVCSVAFDPTGRILASGGRGNLMLWEADSGRLMHELEAEVTAYSIAFDPTGRTLAKAGGAYTIELLEADTGRLLRTLEGHTGIIDCLAFSQVHPILASKSDDGSIRLWQRESGQQLASIPEVKGRHSPQWPSIAFNPSSSLLATVGSRFSKGQKEKVDSVIHIWELDIPVLLEQTSRILTGHYVNAKVVLLGDTGVGKSGISLVLNGKPFEATDSTPGRRVWTFQSQEVEIEGGLRQTREALLWDLAGQPGYRVIHQLHLNEVAVALVVFDARSEIDPLAGVRHWERALRLAQQRQGAVAVPMRKFLVSARTDRGAVSVSKERLEALLKEYGFDGYFETSAKEGWQIKELGDAIRGGIPWDVLPEVTSSVLFADIKAFLLEVKKGGRLVALASHLYDEFAVARPAAAAEEPNLRAQFDTCIGRLENRDLIRRLSFGGYVLLQPELLDAYASAMVNAAKEEPDGLGSIAEDAALLGQFYVPKEQKVEEWGQEQLLLHATVEELARHELALRENAADGRYLVFPSQFNRDYEDAPEPKGKALAVTFDGPVQSLYATLAVRLGHSGLFTTGRSEMWRNAAVFSAKAGGKCGLYLHEFAEGRGRLVIFYDQDEGQSPSDETRFHFEEFVLAHVVRRALEGTVDEVRFFVCPNCGDAVPDNYVRRLRDRGLMKFNCPCGGEVSLAEPKERLRYPSKVEAMERSADHQRDFEMFVESARGETSTPSFTTWAGDERVTLAIVFTDVVGSTVIGEELRDDRMSEVRRAHFAQSRRLIGQHKGREIKTIGDSFMAAFRSVDKALDFAKALQASPGHPQVQIRAGIHIGPMQVEEDDVFGGAVNFAARVVGAIKGAEIWLSDRAKDDLDRSGTRHHRQLRWQRHDGVQMKGFAGTFTLWSLDRPSR